MNRLQRVGWRACVRLTQTLTAAAATTNSTRTILCRNNLLPSSITTSSCSIHTQASVMTAVTAATPTYDSHESHPPPPQLAKHAWIKSMEEYQRMYKSSLSDPHAFWKSMANENIDWFKPFHTVSQGEHNWDTQWFVGGQLNACYNCVDRHVKDKGDKTAILWESDEGTETRRITYRQLHEEVQRVANVLKSFGAKKGTAVTLYMPMIPEAAIAMLACARIGAVHNVVFAGFSAESLRDRIQMSSSSIVITSDELMRGGKKISIKQTMVDTAVKECPTVQKVLVVQRTGTKVNMQPGRDVWLHEAKATADPICAPVMMDSDDPLFSLFTSGSTGKPKGLVHSTGGFMTYAAVTTKYAFDMKDSDVYMCGADIGWITGHTYLVYGPLALGATTLMFEGHPSYPHVGRYSEMIQKHRITILYTSPTTARSLMRFGTADIKKYDRSSLRLLGSVGEPINPEAWNWLYQEIGDSRCPIIDTYWQTESGGILLSPIPGATTLKPGSATFPFFGVDAALLDTMTHEELIHKPGQEQTGALVIKRPWPGLARRILNDTGRYKAAYFNSKEHPEFYITGDSAKRDGEGYYWIIGRMDDVINVSGHRIGSAEVESAIATHPAAAESAVVSMPHPIKGEALFAFVSLKQGMKGDANFVKEVKNLVATHIGKLAIPDHILVVEHLPKTRSGKIMRRLLRQLVIQKTDAASLGDTSTLLDPSVVDVLKHQVNALLAAAPHEQK